MSRLDHGTLYQHGNFIVVKTKFGNTFYVFAYDQLLYETDTLEKAIKYIEDKSK